MFVKTLKPFYITTIFISALLLFMVQPMIAKIILPELGGSPAVWQTVMLFFQLLLLGGYGYVHFTTQKLSVKSQIITHRIIAGLGFIFLPLSLYTDVNIDRNIYPVLWLFESLLYSISLPFFILSTTAPILQRWFSLGNDPDAKNPYFLYSASNAGSLIALLSYPVLIEPMLSVSEQRMIWSILYIVFFGMIFFISTKVNNNTTNHITVEQSVPPLWKTQLTWGFLSFIPSSLMLGITTFITTDVAAIPLLWILPFALYLVSFIFVFSPKMVGYNLSKKLFPFILLTAVFLTMFTNIWTIIISMICFFLIIIRFHGELVIRKPKSEHLTYFYLWMSVGGALGGIFNAVIAPVLFTSAIEYHLILILSAVLISPITFKPVGVFIKSLVPVIIIALLYTSSFWIDKIFGVGVVEYLDKTYNYFFMRIIITLGLILILMRKNSVGFGICLVILLIPILFNINKAEILFQDRNFFGVSRVMYDNNYQANIYKHGTTNHGMQSVLEPDRLKPQTYYSTPLEEIFNNMASDIRKKPIAITGLGVGTSAYYALDKQKIDIYEIDPIVISVAQNPKYFTYLRDCKGDKNIILGDARLNLVKAPKNYYGIMLMDAYSSDSLPVHLLTKQALDIYKNTLDKDGVIAFHITNRHLNLEPVLYALAKDINMTGYIRENAVATDMNKDNLKATSTWVVLSNNPDTLKNLPEGENGWRELSPKKSILWTDDYSSIFAVLK